MILCITQTTSFTFILLQIVCTNILPYSVSILKINTFSIREKIISRVARIQTRVCVFVCAFVCAYVCVFLVCVLCVSVFVCLSVCVVFACVYLCLCTFARVCVHVCVYLNSSDFLEQLLVQQDIRRFRGTITLRQWI